MARDLQTDRIKASNDRLDMRLTYAHFTDIDAQWWLRDLEQCCADVRAKFAIATQSKGAG